MGGQLKPPGPVGYFIGDVVEKQLHDPSGIVIDRDCELKEPFSYIDPTGTEWAAPAGSIVNGASIPWYLWSLTGGPYEGRYRRASVIHDVYCVSRQRPWQYTHNLFYWMCRADGMPVWKALLLWAAVYLFGPKW